MKIRTETRLTSAEIGDLWASYMVDSMAVCTLKHFSQTVEDPDFKPLLRFALDNSEKHVKVITKIFKEEGLPVPQGFTDADVNLAAPRLFSDIFYPFYMEHLARFGMAFYSLSLPLMARSDVREFISDAIASSTRLSNQVVDVLLKKGLYVRPPYISVPDMATYVTDRNFLGGWLGKNRPVHVIELLNIFSNIRTNVVGHTLMLGFGQVAITDSVRKFILRGRDIATKHIETFSDILRNEDIPASTNWDAGVTKSTVAPFSEKLIMFQIAQMAAASIGNYGAGIATCMRRDLIATYTRLMAEAGSYAADGLNIMIDNGWLEQPPQNIDHKGLAAK